jgi:hypothetical protein
VVQVLLYSLRLSTAAFQLKRINIKNKGFTIMSVKIQLRRGLASQWTSTIVLSAGEPGYETDTGKFKIGNGITQWGSLPYAAPDTSVVDLEDLANVTVGTLVTGQVLKWNGSAWANAADASVTNLDGLSDVTLTSPSSGQFLRYSSGAWRNETTTDINTTYTFNATVPTAPDTGANLVLVGSNEVTNTVRLIPGTNTTITRTSPGTINISGQNVTTTADAFSSGGSTGATFKLTNGSGALSSINFVGSGSAVISRLNATNIKVDVPNFTLGVESLAAGGGAIAARIKITNSITEALVGTANLFAGTGMELTIGSGPTANNITINNVNGRVAESDTAGRIAYYDTASNVVVPTGAALSWNKTTATLGVTGRVDATTLIGETVQVTDAIVANEVASSGSLVKGLVFGNHYASTTVNGLILQRSTGTRLVPTAVTAGMQLGKISFVGRGVDNTYTLSGMISATAYGTLASGSIPTALAFLATAQGGTLAPVAIIQDGKFLVNEITHRTGTTLTLSSSVLVDTITARTTNGNLTLAGNGTGTVALPAGTTVGGVLIGTIVLKGTVATSAALPGSGNTTGDAYIALSPTPTRLWVYNGSSFVDLGAFQGPAGTNGQGVPTGGTTGQYLRKTSGTDYATAFATIAYSDVSGTPVLATVATSGSYDDLTGLPIIPEDVSDLLDSTGLLFSGDYADLTGAPTIPEDISELDDATNLLFDGAYASLTGKPTIPTNLDSLTDVVVTTPTTGQVLKYNGTNWVNDTDATGGGGGAGLGSRTAAAATTGSLPNGATGNISITGFKSYALLKVQTSAAAWVRIYTDSTSRSNDSSRAEGTDPTPGAGVIAEVITTGAQTVVITPGTIGFNNDGTPATTIYAAVTNKSGSTATITTTLTVLQLEA